MSMADRLSALPDDILINILSFRPLKSAIATDILSRRWRHLWTHLRAIRFHNLTHDFLLTFDQIMKKLASPLIHTFTLQFSKHYVHSSHAQALLHSWIRHVCQRHVRHLNIKCHSRPLIKAPACVVQTRSLVSIKLRPKHWFNAHPITLLPNLKQLDIYVFPSQFDWLCRLIALCLLLEELSIRVVTPRTNNERRRYNETVVIVNCSNPNLKRLSMIIGYDRLIKKVVIDAPKLDYLYVNAAESPAIVFRDKPITLQEAEVVMTHPSTKKQPNDEHFDLYQAISNVRILTLKFADYPLIDLHTFTSFSNLTHLTLRLSQRPEIDTLLEFLVLCPVLDDLILIFNFKCAATVGHDDHHRPITPQRTFGQVLSKVEIVTSYRLHAQHSLYFSALTKYVLGNAPSLDRFVFSVLLGLGRQPLYEEGERSFWDSISTFPRASANCEVVFTGKCLAIPPEDEA